MNRFFTLLFAASCLTAVGQVPDYVPTDGLVGWWPFEGTLQNVGSNGDEGLAYDGGEGISYGTTYGPDRFFNAGAALQIEYGAFAYLGLDFALELTPTDTITIAFWSKPDTNGVVVLTKYQNGNAQNSSWFVGNHWTEGVRAFGNGSSGTPNDTQWYSTCPNSTNGWAHAVVVYRGGTTSLWVNGTSICEVTNPVSPTSQTQPVIVGRSNCPDETNCNYSSGQFDDLGIWSRALNEAEISGLYESTNVMGCTDMIACNYNPEAMLDDGTCYDCDIPASHCGVGTVWDAEAQTCIVANPSDSNFDGCVQLNDLLDLLTAYGNCAAEDSPWQCGDPLEYQGYDYETVQIGEQCWFAENLRAESYRNGDVISQVNEASNWQSLSEGGRRIYGVGDLNCGAEGDTIGLCSQSSAEVLDFGGYLYNWFVVAEGAQVCPNGWYVPDNDAFNQLLEHAENLSVDPSGFKSTDGWAAGREGTNQTGFNAIGSGYGGNLGNFGSDGYLTGFWSVNNSGANNAYHLQIDERPFSATTGDVFINDNNKKYALSIRCIKDAE